MGKCGFNGIVKLNTNVNMEEINERQPVTFNLGIEWNYKISNKIDAAMSSYMNGDMPNWFFNMKAVKFLLIAYLNKDERDELLKLENEIVQRIKGKQHVGPLVEKYDIRVKDLLAENGFLNPKKKDQTGLYGQ